MGKGQTRNGGMGESTAGLWASVWSAGKSAVSHKEAGRAERAKNPKRSREKEIATGLVGLGLRAGRFREEPWHGMGRTGSSSLLSLSARDCSWPLQKRKRSPGVRFCLGLADWSFGGE